MTLFADLLSTVFERRYRLPFRTVHPKRPIGELIQNLMGTMGETSGIALAREILSAYAALKDDAKLAVFHQIATDLNFDPENVRTALIRFEKDPTKANYQAFIMASEPPRQELFRRLNGVPGATGALVNMRADLRRLAGNDPVLGALDLDLQHLFSSWFNRGFLVLRPINWESPAHILEKIIKYEAVHAIDSWAELRRRVEPEDRRCFAFFHPAMPDEPLIFVEVALTVGTPNSVQDLLDVARTEIPAPDANTAVFYSISNCQPGLAKISFGNSLIKQVAADLSAELPTIGTFVTLSPVPRLRGWLEDQGLGLDEYSPEEVRALAAYYLVFAKKTDGLPVDPVARFHLNNGAILQAVHAQSDVSEKGHQQSGGVMANYLYDLDRTGQNHERFVTGSSFATSTEITALLKTAQRLFPKEA